MSLPAPHAALWHAGVEGRFLRDLVHGFDRLTHRETPLPERVEGKFLRDLENMGSTGSPIGKLRCLSLSKADSGASRGHGFDRLTHRVKQARPSGKTGSPIGIYNPQRRAL